jgi:hypothetical protein
MWMVVHMCMYTCVHCLCATNTLIELRNYNLHVDDLLHKPCVTLFFVCVVVLHVNIVWDCKFVPLPILAFHATIDLFIVCTPHMCLLFCAHV